MDTLTKHSFDIVNRQLDVEIIHVDTNGQYSITASQNIFNSIYMTNVEAHTSNQGSCQPAKHGRPIGTRTEMLTRSVKD